MDIWDKQCSVVWVKGLNVSRSRARASRLESVTCYPQTYIKRRWSALRHDPPLCGALHLLAAEGITLTHEPKLSDSPYLLPFNVL